MTQAILPDTPTTETARRPASLPSAAAAKRRSRRRYGAVMKVIRRLHMYFGLILVPFVLLYGITAMLFNHQTWFSATTVVDTDPDLLESVSLPSADVIADAVLAEMIEKTGIEMTRVEGTTASFTGDLFIDLPDDEARHRYRVNPDDMSATLQITPLAPKVERETPFPDEVEKREEETLKAIVTTLKETSGREKGSLRFMPDIEFRVNAEDQDWTVTYDLRSGDVSDRLTEEPSRPFSMRSFLLRLHKSAGYPREAGSRMGWAVIVDLISGLMIFWGLSGIVMWWQMRPFRRTGLILVVAGIALSAVLGYGMLQLIYY